MSVDLECSYFVFEIQNVFDAVATLQEQLQVICRWLDRFLSLVNKVRRQSDGQPAGCRTLNSMSWCNRLLLVILAASLSQQGLRSSAEGHLTDSGQSMYLPAQMVEITEGATNRGRSTVTILPIGIAFLGGTAQSARLKVVPADIFKKLYADIVAAMPLSQLRVGPCMKSVSFGRRLFVSYGAERSPDLDCPKTSDSRVVTLNADIAQLWNELSKQPEQQSMPLSKKNVSDLIEAFQSSDGFGKQKLAPIMGALAASNPAIQSILLKDSSSDSNAQVRSTIAASIGATAKGGDAAAVRTLANLIMHDPDEHVRVMACSQLTRLPGRAAALDAMRAALKDSSAHVRWSALNLIHSIGKQALPLAPDLAEFANGSDDPSQRSQAIFALGDLGEPAVTVSVPALKKLLSRRDDKHASVSSSLHAIATIGPAAAGTLPEVVALLTDENTSTRRSAAHALGKMGSSAASAVPYLRQALTAPFGTADFKAYHSQAQIDFAEQQCRAEIERAIRQIESNDPGAR